MKDIINVTLSPVAMQLVKQENLMTDKIISFCKETCYSIPVTKIELMNGKSIYVYETEEEIKNKLKD